jgi:4-amino-4-deoxy-L-arabinose transferase-like glycosyltransferase
MRAVLRRVPAAAWVCAAIALLNAAAWSLITPPFQGKDEVDHFAYVEQLAETGTLPKEGDEQEKKEAYSRQELNVMLGIHYYEVRFTPSNPTVSTAAEQRALVQDAKAGAPRVGSGYVGIATPEPPLYYVLQLIPYALGSPNMLVQLQLMRLLGVLLGALTALFTFLFLREALPALPWAATVGALCVALQPLFGFMSGSVNPDTLLYTIAAALFLCLARAFRRGLTRRLAVAFGLLIAAGFMTKLNFVGLAFGVFAGLVVLGVREARARGWEALRAPTLAAGIGLAPVVLYALRNLLSSHPTFGAVSGTATADSSSLFKELSYTWELYLPRLPGMPHYFNGMTTYKDIWFDRSVGMYGWMDTVFPTWVDNVALVPAGVVALLCGRELLARRAALRARLSELGVYATITLGVLVLVGVASYHTDVIERELAFGEPRYLLPMLPLLGAVLVLAVRGAGRRWAPVAGAAMVVLFLGHDVFSQLQVIARYYG